MDITCMDDLKAVLTEQAETIQNLESRLSSYESQAKPKDDDDAGADIDEDGKDEPTEEELSDIEQTLFSE